MLVGLFYLLLYLVDCFGLQLLQREYDGVTNVSIDGAPVFPRFVADLNFELLKLVDIQKLSTLWLVRVEVRDVDESHQRVVVFKHQVKGCKLSNH